MAKTYRDLVLYGHIPATTVEAMNNTEPGILATFLEEMVYARSHDDKMYSKYPEKLYVHSKISDYKKEKFGVDGSYVKSDVVMAKVIEFLDAMALEYVLKGRS